MNQPEWYAAKTIYKHHTVEDGVSQMVFEERIVLFHATNFEDAIAKAETEAIDYFHTVTGTEYLGFVDVYHIDTAAISHGTEVYSLMRNSKLSDKDYLNHFYDNGKEHRLRSRGSA